MPSPVAGRLAEIVAPEGTTVGPAALLASIAAGEGAAPAVAAAPAPVAAATPAEAPRGAEDAPPAKKLMADAGLSRDSGGHGRDGRVMKEDVLAAIAQPKPPAPAAPPVAKAPVPVADAAREERVKMTRLRQTIARRLKDARTPPPC